MHTGHFEEEFRITRPDGEVRWVGVSASPVRRGDEIVRLVGSVQDITARKMADSQVALHLAEAEAARKQADDARAEAEALHKAAVTLTQDLRMDAVLDTLLQTLFQIVPYDTASVILTEDESRERLFVAREAPPSPAGRTVVTLETGDNRLLQRVLILKKTVHLADTSEEIDWRENKASATSIPGWRCPSSFRTTCSACFRSARPSRARSLLSISVWRNPWPSPPPLPSTTRGSTSGHKSMRRNGKAC